jgi:hypothetical protein
VTSIKLLGSNWEIMIELKYCYNDAYLINHQLVSGKKLKLTVGLDPIWNKNMAQIIVVSFNGIENFDEIKKYFDNNILLNAKKRTYLYSIEIKTNFDDISCKISFDCYGDIIIKCKGLTENKIYISNNEIETFHFHDSFFADIKFSDNQLIWTIKELNVDPDNSQNSFQDPMEIENAVVTFKDYKITHLKTETGTHKDCNGVVLHENEVVVYDENNYKQEILELFPDSIIYECCVINENSCRFHINAGIFVEIIIEYSDLTIEWDNFIGKAWYAK